MAPDELDRLFRRLVENLTELDPSRLHRPFAVSELYESLVPYRTHRLTLGIDTNQDYEMTVLRLLAGERGYVSVEPEEVRATLVREAGSINPDTALFRRFATAKVRLDPDHVSEALGKPGVAPEVSEAPAAQAAVGPALEPEPPASAEEQMPLPFVLAEEEEEEERPVVQPREPGGSASAPCAYCGGELPIGRAVLFCPHCGQNVGVVHCPTCDTELDVGWRFCTACGHKMAGLG